MYEVTVTKTFCAAHAIRLPDGSLEPIHGHNWQTQVTVAADALNNWEAVMDFHQLEQLVDQQIQALNNRNLNDTPSFANDRLNPTAERVAWWIGTQVAKRLPQGVRFVSASVTEAPGCQAVYRA